MNRLNQPPYIQHQRGAVTLLISVVLLISVTLIVLVSSQAVVTEQRIAANQVRAKESYEAGNAGISYVIAQAQSGGPTSVSGAVATPSGAPSFNASTTFVGDALLVTSVGSSDDNSASRTLFQNVIGTPALASAPENPLTAKGTIDMQGSGTIWNLESTNTIWSGETIDVTGMSGKTVIKHDEHPDGYIESSNAANKGVDIVDNDPNLGTLSDDDYFRNFFGVTPDVYENSIARLVFDIDDGDDPDIIDQTDELDGVTSTIIWVNGTDPTFNGNATIGTLDNPVVLIVDADLESSVGNVTVYGFMFVTGDWDQGSGNFTVHGAAVVRGDVSTSGSLDIYYNSSVLNNLNVAGKAAGIPGTWRDWN